VIAELRAIAETNRDTAEKATEHREYIESEIEDSHNHIEWIHNRIIAIKEKLEELNVTRCEMAMLFVQSLKEHSDALVAIEMLMTDLDRSEAAGEAPILADVGTFSSKLQAYEHLFEKQAMSEFFQVGDDHYDYLGVEGERSRVSPL